MDSLNIIEIKKEATKHLDDVFIFMDRTVAVRFFSSTKDIEASWEDSQFELGFRYQYEAVSENIWDYYLILACDFDEASLEAKIRFSIENDRFCCRKHFAFNTSKKNYSREKLISKLFPNIIPTSTIKMLQPSSIISDLEGDIKDLVPTTFYVEDFSEEQILGLADKLINEGIKNETTKDN